MHLRPLVLTTAFVTSALVGCSRDEFAPWGFAQDVSLECSSPARGQVGVAYSYTPTVETGVQPLKFSVDPSTPLPPGLTIDEDTGTISGTPTAEGMYPLKIVVVDGRDNESVITCGDIIIDPGAGIDCRDESVEPGDIPDGFVGYVYNFQPTAAGGRPPYTNWTATNLPPGLTIDPANGLISGTPTETGVFTVTLTATDADGQELAGECGVLEIRDPIVVDTDSLLAAYPDGCISYGETLSGLIDKGIVIPVKDATVPPVCSLVAGRGNGSRNFDGNKDTPDSFPPGIAVSADTCELSGTVDSKLRFGIYAWITTIEQSGTKAYLPYCAPQDVQAGTAYPIARTDAGTDKTLAPGHIVFDVDAVNPPTFTFGNDTPDPQVRVEYTEDCAGSCFYAYIFSYNALSAAASVSASPSAKFPAMGFDGFTHAIRVTESDETFLRNYGGRAFVTNISYDYCMAQNDQDCGNNEADPDAKAALIRANGDGSNYEFGLIVLPAN